MRSVVRCAMLGLFALLLLAPMNPVATQTPPEAVIYTITTNRARVRAEASTSSETLITLSRNALIAVMAETSGGRVENSTSRVWLAVRLRDHTGYIHTSLAEPFEADAACPVRDALCRRLSCAEARACYAEDLLDEDYHLDIDGDGQACEMQCNQTSASSSAPPGIRSINTTCPDMNALCRQLTCEQAYACLEAGHSRLDSDGDGRPCESQCGG